MEHIVATTLIHGQADTKAFGEDTLLNPNIMKLRKNINLESFEPEMEWPNDRPARLKIQLNDGAILIDECLSAKGGPDLPFNSADIESKVRDLVGGNLSYLSNSLIEILNLEEDVLKATWREVIGPSINFATSSA